MKARNLILTAGVVVALRRPRTAGANRATAAARARCRPWP